MLIRSQNKKGIVNLNQVVVICTNVIKPKDRGIRECYETDIVYSTENRSGWLGTYSSEEKAIKVLDMIQNKYFEHMTVESNGAIVQILERPKTFQMPQDEEV